MLKLIKVFFTVCVLFLFKPVHAQDIRAAWMEYKWLYGYTYSITLVLITDDNIDPDGHCKATIYCGDSCTAYRQNGTLGPSSAECSVSYQGIIIAPGLRKSAYSCAHTFGGPGTFNVYSKENYRVAGIKNIDNSFNKYTWIETSLPLNQFSGPNSTPSFSPPALTALKDSIYTHNFGLSDPDGSDSLSYHIVNCDVTPANAYYIPANCGINATGSFTYQADTVGLYAFKVLVKEWRSSQLIGYNEIDFTIEVKTAVGIDEFEKKNNISLSPNPTSDFITINTGFHPKEMEIINSLGRTVQRLKFSKTINVSNLESGFYFIRIENSYSKFIKN